MVVFSTELVEDKEGAIFSWSICNFVGGEALVSDACMRLRFTSFSPVDGRRVGDWAQTSGYQVWLDDGMIHACMDWCWVLCAGSG